MFRCCTHPGPRSCFANLVLSCFLAACSLCLSGEPPSCPETRRRQLVSRIRKSLRWLPLREGQTLPRDAIILSGNADAFRISSEELDFGYIGAVLLWVQATFPTPAAVEVKLVDGGPLYATPGLDASRALLNDSQSWGVIHPATNSLGGIGVSFFSPKFGPEVFAVAAKSPAADAGLRKGDLITHVDGDARFVDTSELRLKIQVASRQGGPIAVRILREGSVHEVEVQPRLRYWAAPLPRLIKWTVHGRTYDWTARWVSAMDARRAGGYGNVSYPATLPIFPAWVTNTVVMNASLWAAPKAQNIHD